MCDFLRITCNDRISGGSTRCHPNALAVTLTHGGSAEYPRTGYADAEYTRAEYALTFTDIPGKHTRAEYA